MAAFGISTLQRLSSRFLLLAIGLGGGGLTLSLYFLQRHDETVQAAHWFKAETESVVQNLQETLGRSAALPQTAAAMARVVPRLDAANWRKFVRDLRPFDATPGLIGYGLAERVDENDLDAFSERMVREGQGALRVYPRTGPGPYWPVTYAEPEEVARYVRGFNLGSEASRRQALAYAVDNAEAGMTGLITVGFSHEARKPPGFLVFYPVYTSDRVPEEVADRRAALSGYALAIFRLDRLIDGLAGGRRDSHVLSLYDMEAVTPQLAYRSSRMAEVEDETFRDRTGFAFGGHAWRLDVAATHEYVDRIDRQRSTGILLVGIVATLGAMTLVYVMARGRQQAEVMAREKSETAKRGEAHFRSLVQLSSDWYWQQDERFRFTELSSGYAKSHLDPKFALGRCRWELPIDLTPTQWAVHRADLDAHRSFQDFEYRIVGQDGQWHWFSVSGAPVFADDGTFAGYRGTARDITDRKDAERQLSLLSLAFNGAREPVYLYRLDTHEVVYVNEEVCHQLGYGLEDLLGKPLAQVEPAAAEQAMQDMAQELLAAGHVVNEGQLRTGDGRMLAVEIDRSLIDFDSERYVLALARDVSERKRREEELRRHCDTLTETIQANAERLLGAKAAAEHADQVKKEFLAAMAHELRPPLEDILSLARLGLDRASSVAVDKLAEVFDRIAVDSDRLLAMAANLLDLSGIEVGGAALSCRPIDLASLVESARRDLAPVFAAMQARCTVEPAVDPAWVEVDVVRMEQVVRSLLLDALRASPAGTDVRVSLTPAHLPGRRAGDQDGLPAVRLTVADRRPALAEDVFERSGVLPGTGDHRESGLDACRAIVVAHGGIMAIRNRHGGGVEFEVLLLAVNQKGAL